MHAARHQGKALFIKLSRIFEWVKKEAAGCFSGKLKT
jgi:hypothetical protein